MIAVGLIAGMDGQVILGGDPLQLGPVLRSKPAKQYGLGLSFLERLINRQLYLRDETKFADHGSYDPLLVGRDCEDSLYIIIIVNNIVVIIIFYHK